MSKHDGIFPIIAICLKEVVLPIVLVFIFYSGLYSAVCGKVETLYTIDKGRYCMNLTNISRITMITTKKFQFNEYENEAERIKEFTDYINTFHIRPVGEYEYVAGESIESITQHLGFYGDKDTCLKVIVLKKNLIQVERRVGSPTEIRRFKLDKNIDVEKINKILQFNYPSTRKEIVRYPF